MRTKDKDIQKEAMLEFWDKHKFSEMVGHLCLVSCGNPEIAKLIGIGRDKYDYYYILKYQDRGLVFETCVERIQCLKGKIDDYDYQLMRFDGFLDMNPQFLQEGASIDMEKLKKESNSDTAVYYTRKEIETNYIYIDDDY